MTKPTPGIPPTPPNKPAPNPYGDGWTKGVPYPSSPK